GARVLPGWVVGWLAAVLSLVGGPGNRWELVVLYVAVAAAGPVVLLWCVQAFSALQRVRFRAVLGVVIPAPRRGAWRTAAPWRQLAYHALAPVTATVGGALVVLCWWLPRVPLGLARADTIAARTLLGPGRADELAQRL